jgi:hypothetical protein
MDILKLQMIGFENESILDIWNSFPKLLIAQLINNRATLTCAQVLTNTHVTVELNGHVCDVSFHTFFFTPQDMNVN